MAPKASANIQSVGSQDWDGSMEEGQRITHWRWGMQEIRVEGVEGVEGVKEVERVEARLLEN